MVTVSMNIGLIVAFILFLIGLVGVLTRRNVLFILMSVEIMLNSAGLAFIVVGAHWVQREGQIMFLFILVMAAAEVALGLALVLQMHRKYNTVDTEVLNLLKD